MTVALHNRINPVPVCANGFGDQYNAYAYSAAVFRGSMYIGTGRANLVFLRFGMPNVHIDMWPVPIEYKNYEQAFENDVSAAEIWRFSPSSSTPKRVHQADWYQLENGISFRRHYGYRSMCTYRDGSRDIALYVASTSRSRGDGPDLMVSYDGESFSRLPKPSIISEFSSNEITLTSIRSLLQYEELLVTTITGASNGNVNGAGITTIFATDDPTSGQWHSINGKGLGTFPEVVVVYELCIHQGLLYAGTGGINGFQLWRGRRSGKYEFTWELVVKDGGGRGALNQGIISLCSHRDYLYIGTGIQNGGHDRTNNVGPAAAEVLRLAPNDELELVCANPRDGLLPLSGRGPGFGNYFNAYIWKIVSIDDRLLLGTMDWSVFGLWAIREERKTRFGRLLDWESMQVFLSSYGGAELWSSEDGVDWNCITRNGFNNIYNFGIRNIVKWNGNTYVCTANPFGPKVLTRTSDTDPGQYEHNPKGGCQIIAL